MRLAALMHAAFLVSIVSQDGVIWQRDLGAGTDAAAKAIQQFDPGDGWAPVAPQA
jgi:hypothetical protein